MDGIRRFLSPYIRLARYNKPTGTWLVFWPFAYASVLSSSYEPITLSWSLLIFTSSFMLHAAGCIANDIWDRDFDKHVKRCQTRPIASGELSVSQGIGFCALNLIPIPLLISLSSPNGVIALYMAVPVITLYPLAKRFTYFPQFVLGVCQNYGLIINYVMLTNTLDWCLLPVYSGLWCWTVINDSIYAYQDVKDDEKAGVKAATLVWKKDYKKYHKGLTVGMAGSMALGGYMTDMGSLFYPTMGIAIWKVVRQWQTLDIDDPKDCERKFDDNHPVGLVMFLAFVLGKLQMKNEKSEEVDKSASLK